ncbi:MAG: protoporphyrinogen oxidase [Marmoricola sp.]
MSSPPAARARHVVVVGGGIAGVAAAHRLRVLRPGLRVTLLEGAPELGGKLALAEVGGILTDVGAEAILARRPEGVTLAREVGLADDVVHPETTTARLWTRGEMRPMPRSLMGVPADVSSLSGVVSRAGLTRAALDAVIPPPRLADDQDVSVGALVGERLGKEVVDRLVEPMLGGVYAGHSRELSARAAVPGLVVHLDGEHSLTAAAAAAMLVSSSERSERVEMAPPPGPGQPAAPVFAGIAGGVGRLPGAVATTSGAVVETGAIVRSLTRTADGWALEVGPTRSPRQVSCDAVVLATPARPTARLLEHVAPAAARELDGVEYASMAVVSLAFSGRDLPETTGSGFLVPPVDGHSVKGATYSFAKWGWVSDAGRDDDLSLLRCSIGRHREEHVLQVSDEELVALAVRDLADAVGLSVLPVDSHVQRWGGGLPQYAVGHVARVQRVRAGLTSVSGVAVCGAAYDGVGIPACIASAHLGVDKVLADLG